MSGKIPIPLPKLSEEFEMELAKLRSLLANRESMRTELDRKVENIEKILSSDKFICFDAGNSLLQMAEQLRKIINQQGVSYEEYRNLASEFIKKVFANDTLLKRHKEVGKLAMSLKDPSNKSSLDKLKHVLENICNLLVKFEWYCRLVQMNQLTEFDAILEVKRTQQHLLDEAKSSRKQRVRSSSRILSRRKKPNRKIQRSASAGELTTNNLEMKTFGGSEYNTDPESGCESNSEDEVCQVLERSEDFHESVLFGDTQGASFISSDCEDYFTPPDSEEYDGEEGFTSLDDEEGFTSPDDEEGFTSLDKDKRYDCVKKNMLDDLCIDECDELETRSRLEGLVNQVENNLPCVLEKLEILDSDIKKEHLLKFLQEIKNLDCEIHHFSIGFGNKSVRDLIPYCCDILKKCCTSKLSFEYDRLQDEDIDLLQKSLAKGTKIVELSISYNKDIGCDGYSKLRQIIVDHHTKIFRAADCNISDDKLLALLQPKRSGEQLLQLEILDISCSKNLTQKAFETLGEYVSSGSVRILNLNGVKLTSETLQAFHEKLAPDNLLEGLDVSYNSTMKPEDYRILGSIVNKCRVNNLRLDGCNLDEERLGHFRKATKDHKMKNLGAADNNSFGKGITEIAETARQHNLEGLDIKNCDLTEVHLSYFRKALGNTKLKSLHLGDRRNDISMEYISEVCLLLPYIKRELHLTYHQLREGRLDALREALGNMGDDKPEVFLNEKKLDEAQ